VVRGNESPPRHAVASYYGHWRVSGWLRKSQELQNMALLMRAAALRDGSGIKVDEPGIKVYESG
jgi:hypothetical protein